MPVTHDGDIIVRGGSHVVMVANRDVLFDHARRNAATFHDYPEFW